MVIQSKCTFCCKFQSPPIANSKKCSKSIFFVAIVEWASLTVMCYVKNKLYVTTLRSRNVVKLKNFCFFVYCKNAKSAVILHFNSFDLDAPRVGGLVEGRLHDVRDRLTFGQNFGQIFCAQNVSESCGGEKASWMAKIVVKSVRKFVRIFFKKCSNFLLSSKNKKGRILF